MKMVPLKNKALAKDLSKIKGSLLVNRGPMLIREIDHNHVFYVMRRRRKNVTKVVN